MRPVSLLSVSSVLGLSLTMLACGDKDDGGDGGDDTGSDTDTDTDTTDTDTDTDTSGPVDADGDGYDDTEDCDDGNADVHPGADELCNDIDDDCDDEVDEDAIDMSTWYGDSDDDGYGTPDVTTDACDQPEGYVADGTDCDDAVATTYPGAEEICNDVDDDCNDTVDDDYATDAATWYADTDEDGYGDEASTMVGCTQPDGYVADATDCDDTVGTTYPGAEETCNDVDDDCNDTVDDDYATDATTWYQDRDEDGFGDSSISTIDCEQPDGFVEDDTDCDDEVDTTFPGAEEICNEVDDDCNDRIDDDATDATTWYQDRDEDGFGNPSASLDACDEPDGYVDDNTDCDDANAAVNPDAEEICNGWDDDCDRATDENGMASWEDARGGLTDWTDAVTGASDSPAAVTLDEEGTLWFCDGDYYVNIVAEADVTVASVSEDADAVVLDGAATGSVVRTETAGVTLSIQDLTLTNGYGSTDPYLGLSTGGGVACSDSTESGTTVNIDGSYLTDNEAYYGAALHTLGCDTNVSDTLVWDNFAAIASGGSLHWDGDHTWTGVQVFENLSDSQIGGSYWTSLTGVVSEVSLDEVLFQDNYAPTLGGVGWAYNDITWTGTDATSSGALGNIDDGGYGAVLYNVGNVGLVADTIDLGEAGTDDDNSPVDVSDSIGGNTFDLGDNVSFICDETGCGVPDSSEIGGTDTDSGGNYILLNAIEAESDALIQTMGMYLSGNSSCTLDWYIFSSDVEPDSDTEWTFEWSETGVPMTDDTGFFTTEPDFWVEAGVWYLMGAGWNCESGYVGYYWSSTRGTEGDAGFGTSTYYRWSSDTTTLSDDSTFNTSGDDAVWYMSFDYLGFGD